MSLKTETNSTTRTPGIGSALAAIFGVTCLFVAAFGIWDFSGLDTEYSPGFSDGAFDQVQVGMPREQVEKLVGAGWCGDAGFEAASRRQGRGCLDALVPYTYTPNKTSYHERAVRYDGDRVATVIKTYYVD